MISGVFIRNKVRICMSVSKRVENVRERGCEEGEEKRKED